MEAVNFSESSLINSEQATAPVSQELQARSVLVPVSKKELKPLQFDSKNSSLVDQLVANMSNISNQLTKGFSDLSDQLTSCIFSSFSDLVAKNLPETKAFIELKEF